MFDESVIGRLVNGPLSSSQRLPISFEVVFCPVMGNVLLPQMPSRSSCRQFATRHPQIGQGEQGGELGRVFPESSIAYLDEAELPLDHPERVLDFGPDTRLDPFNLVHHDVDGPAPAQDRPLARAHGDMPLDVRRRVGPFLRTLVARIGKDVGFCPVQQRVGFDHVMNVGRRAPHAMHQTRLRIRANMGLHAKVPFIAFLGLMHLGVALTAGVLGRGRRGNQRGVHHRARPQYQSLLAQQRINFHQDLPGQLVFLQQMPEAQDGALVRESVVPVVQAGKLPEQRHIMQRFFHGRITQGEPLLHEVNPQHRFHAERRAASPALGRNRRDQGHQSRPWHDPIHVIEKLTFACAFGRQIQSRISLFHSSNRRSVGDFMQALLGCIYADLP